MQNSLDKIDLNNLLQLIGNDKDFLRELLETFISTTQDALTQLKEAEAKDDWKQIQSIAHQIAPAIMQIGGNNAYKAIKEIENMPETTQGYERKSKYTELIPHIDNCLVQVQNYISNDTK